MKILFFPYTEELGTTHVLVRIAEVLQSSGHEIVFAGEGKFAKFISNYGFDVLPIVEVPFEKHFSHAAKASMAFHTASSIEMFVKSEIKIIEDVCPDIVVDLFRPTLYISSKVTKTHRVSVCNAVLTKYYDLPLEIPEAHWSFGIFQNSFTKSLMYPASKVVSSISFKIWAVPYNKILAKYNLQPISSILDLFDGDTTLIMDAEEFAPLKADRGKQIFTVGPILHNIQANFPKWIDDLDKSKKVIYLSMGSTGSLFPIILRDLIDLYGNDNEYQIVANTVGMVDKKKLNIPKNFFVEELINPNAILPKTSVLLTHGGRGTLYHALTYGVPIIGFPHQPEQEWNINRLESLSLGAKLSKKNYSKELLSHTLTKVINDPIYKINALHFQNILNSYEGAESAAQIIINAFSNEKKDSKY